MQVITRLIIDNWTTSLDKYSDQTGFFIHNHIRIWRSSNNVNHQFRKVLYLGNQTAQSDNNIAQTGRRSCPSLWTMHDTIIRAKYLISFRRKVSSETWDSVNQDIYSSIHKPQLHSQSSMLVKLKDQTECFQKKASSTR